MVIPYNPNQDEDWFNKYITYWSNVVDKAIVENRHTLLPLYINSIDISAQFLKNQGKTWNDIQDEIDRMKKRYLNLMEIYSEIALNVNKSK